MNKNVILLSISNGMIVTSNSILIASAPLIGSSLTSNRMLATLPLTMLFVGILLTSFPASFLMGKIGRKRGFIFGSGFGIFGALVTSYSIWLQDFKLFCSGIFLIGIFNGFAIYFRFAAIESAISSLKNHAIAYVLAGGVIAALIGPNLANWSKNWFPSTAFLGSYLSLNVIFIFALICLSLLSKFPTNTNTVDSSTRSLLTIAKQPVFILAALSAIIAYGSMSLLMSATPLAMASHNHSFADTAFVISWHIVGMFAPSFFTGSLINKIGVSKTILLGISLGVASIGINFLGTSTNHFWLALLLLGVSWNFMYIGGTSLLTLSYTEAEKAKTQALNDFLVFVMLALTTLTAGILHHLFGWIVINIVVLPLYLLAMIIALVYYKKLQPEI